MEKSKRIKWIECAIIAGAFLNVLYFVFIKDISLIRTLKQTGEIKTQNHILQIDTMPKINKLPLRSRKTA